MGETGEYSDRTDWSVVAFTTEKAAKERAKLAQRKAKELFDDRDSKYRSRDDEKNEYDPNFQMDYTGTYYFIMEVEVES